MSRRLLICVPILHTETDLGSLAPQVRAQAQAQAGVATAWEQRQATIAAFWKGVASWAARLPKNLSRYRIYQDALPVCGSEHAIVQELSDKGSANHRIVLDLLSRGAQLEGTESPELLVEEYRLAQASLKQGASDHDAARKLLVARDSYIAARIVETLKQGETGVLFIGMLHDVLSHLPPSFDIQKVTRPS